MDQKCLKKELISFRRQEVTNILISGLIKTAKDDAKGAGLNPLQAAKAALNTGKNTKTLTQGLAKFGEVVEACKSAATDIPTLVPKIKAMIEAADEEGKKAHEKGWLKPDECFDLHSGEKKSAAEIQAEEDEKNNKGKGKGKGKGKDKGKGKGKK